MRILITGNSHRAEIRGPIIYYEGLARSLRDRGHEVSLLQAAKPEHRFEIPGVRMLYTSLTSKSVYPLRVALRRAGRFDVIHSNGPSGSGFALRSRLHHVPQVAMFHAPRMRHEPFLQANWRWRHIELTARNAPNLMTSTRWLADAVAARFEIDPAHFIVIPLGIAESWYRAAREPASQHGARPRIALINMKGVDVALRAFASAGLAHLARLELYGVDPHENLHRALARELGIAAQVQFMGFVPNAELATRVADADLLLHPTRAESFGQVLGEAAALGIPCIASRVNAVPEVVVDGETGLLCPVDDVDAFASALAKLLGDTEWRRRMGQAARARAEQLWRWSTIAERLEREVYEPIARRESPRPADA